MNTPNLRLLCRATWVRGNEIEWWVWAYDKQSKEYVSGDDKEVLPRSDLWFSMSKMASEGWQLCRTVV